MEIANVFVASKYDVTSKYSAFSIRVYANPNFLQLHHAFIEFRRREATNVIAYWPQI